jgi:anti-anti-sigma regulatory factor
VSGWDDELAAPEAHAAAAAIPLRGTPDAAALLAALRAWPAGESPRLDASEATHLPMPVLQVLLAAMRAASAIGGRLTIRNPAFAFSLAFEALGFTEADEPFTVEYD